MSRTFTLLASIGLLFLLISARGPIAIVHADVPVNPDDVMIGNAVDPINIDTYSLCALVGVCEQLGEIASSDTAAWNNFAEMTGTWFLDTVENFPWNLIPLSLGVTW